MEMHEPVTVFETASALHAEIIKNALDAEGIPCILAGIEQASTAALPGTSVQIQVPAAEAERARALIAAHEPPPEAIEVTESPPE
jgi:hypothetical protein